MSSRKEIEQWFKAGVKDGYKRMIVWTDSFDQEAYPQYTYLTDGPLRDYCSMNNGLNMKRLTEVYDLTIDLRPQILKTHNFNY